MKYTIEKFDNQPNLKVEELFINQYIYLKLKTTYEKEDLTIYQFNQLTNTYIINNSIQLKKELFKYLHGYLKNADSVSPITAFITHLLGLLIPEKQTKEDIDKLLYKYIEVNKDDIKHFKNYLKANMITNHFIKKHNLENEKNFFFQDKTYNYYVEFYKVFKYIKNTSLITYKIKNYIKTKRSKE